MVEIRTVEYSKAKGQLLDLFRASFGHTMSEEFWNWKYLQNPLTDPEVIVALDNGRIVGARPFLLAEMWLGSERVIVAQHCDTMVHPEYQGRGIFKRMGEFAIRDLKEKGFALSYGFPGPMSRPGFLRQGWRTVAQTETLFRPLKSKKLISYKLGNKILGAGLGLLYDNFLDTRIQPVQICGSFQVKLFDRFAADELKEVDSLRDASAIDLVRKERYLRWRFDSHPEHDYRHIVVKKDEKLVGYAVIRVNARPDGVVEGIIVDYLVRHADVDCFRVLIGKCLNELKESGCDIVTVWAFSVANLREQLLKHFGFKSLLKFPYSRFVNCGYLDALYIDEKLADKIDIYDARNWRVTYAYPDTT